MQASAGGSDLRCVVTKWTRGRLTASVMAPLSQTTLGVIGVDQCSTHFVQKYRLSSSEN